MILDYLLKKSLDKIESHDTRGNQFYYHSEHDSHKDTPTCLQSLLTWFPYHHLSDYGSQEGTDYHAQGWEKNDADQHPYDCTPKSISRGSKFFGASSRNNIIKGSNDNGDQSHYDQEIQAKRFPPLGGRQQHQGQKTEGRAWNSRNNTPD